MARCAALGGVMSELAGMMRPAANYGRAGAGRFPV
jgi:hypothetical protein